MHRDSFSPCNTIRPGRTVHWRPAGAALASLRASINAKSVSFWVCAFRFRAERGAVPAMFGVVGRTGCWRLAVPTERSCEGGLDTPRSINRWKVTIFIMHMQVTMTGHWHSVLRSYQ